MGGCFRQHSDKRRSVVSRCAPKAGQAKSMQMPSDDCISPEPQQLFAPMIDPMTMNDTDWGAHGISLEDTICQQTRPPQPPTEQELMKKIAQAKMGAIKNGKSEAILELKGKKVLKQAKLLAERAGYKVYLRATFANQRGASMTKSPVEDHLEIRW